MTGGDSHCHRCSVNHGKGQWDDVVAFNPILGSHLQIIPIRDGDVNHVALLRQVSYLIRIEEWPPRLSILLPFACPILNPHRRRPLCLPSLPLLPSDQLMGTDPATAAHVSPDNHREA